ncbi:DUF1499 domain-containing protein [Cyanobium sp. CH-040]|uniref:DUF1499 domain-containing protein n=1 Tax=Cyanobium sp. CH-040 TaxID=2823708 RepID=UPI0020CE1B55|nr:DUF1499 domain-containing protein [Cyanobium sp. CH-040]MCP9928767.1 DUF1499 domain-containing protein [Cyanobium sp. CH-040]
MSGSPPPPAPRWPLLALALALLLLAPGPAGASLLHLEGPRPDGLGVPDGRLPPCASSAHCARADWPLADPAAALAGLAVTLARTPGISVLEQRADYLHATATSRIFGFVDDLELLADPARGLLQARSESRLGDSDLGVNARRLARLQAQLPSDRTGA